jgi:ribonuclease VapC
MSEQLLVVLDASALLALLHQEPGADRVRRSIQSDKVVMSAINYAEVIAKHLQKGKDFGALRDNLQALGILIIPFDKELSEAVGQLKPKTMHLGLSLADCACLTLSRHINAIALTADTAWGNLKNDFNVEVIRSGR